MVIIRDLARAAYLDQVFQSIAAGECERSLTLIAFLLVFVVGLIALYYMIRLIFKSKTQQS